MPSPCRLPCALAALLAGLGLASGAEADFIPVARLSEITFNGVNLGTGGEPGPDASRQSTDQTAPFSEVLSGSASAAEPGGAINSGTWLISQTTTILPDVVTSENSQTATTTTDFGSPGIFTRSTFRFDFRVESATQILLEGSIVGSSNPASDLFARVMLKQGAATLFNTSFSSGTFPFITTLLPNEVYTLTAEVAGETLFNNTTTSSANVRLSIVPEPSALALAGIGFVALIVRRAASGRGGPFNVTAE
jgi:hypothetical protein